MQRTWLITGVTSGFGRLVAEKVLERGDRVAGTTRKPEALAQLIQKYGEELLWLSPLELTDASACRSVVDAAFTRYGRIDVLLSNAGYGLVGAAEELTDEQITHQIDTNLLGSIRVIRASLPHMRKQGSGRILQVSSSGGQIAYPMFSAYHATKWGIEGFVEAVGQEVAPFGIEFTLVEPGGTETSFSSSAIQAEPMEEYEATPVGELRRVMKSTGFPLPGDAHKVAEAIIASVDRHPAPKRLPLGSDTYTQIHGALEERLELLTEQKLNALAVDKNS